MHLSDRVSVAAQVMAREVGNETVILDLASGTYYGLDPVGARIWQLLADGNTLGQACDTMLLEFDATREVIERDLLVLVESLRERNMVSVAS